MASPLGIALAQTNQNQVPGRPGAVAPTDVGNIVAQSSDAAYKSYAAKLQQQNAMFGGLAGLGGAGVLAFGPKLSGYLFGPGSTTPQMASMLGPMQAPSGLLGDTAAADFAPSAVGGVADATGAAAPLALDAGTAAAADAGTTAAAGLGSVAAADTAATLGADAAAAGGTDVIGSLLAALPLLLA